MGVGGGGRGSVGDLRNQYPANAPRTTKIIALSSSSKGETSSRDTPLGPASSSFAIWN